MQRPPPPPPPAPASNGDAPVESFTVAAEDDEDMPAMEAPHSLQAVSAIGQQPTAIAV